MKKNHYLFLTVILLFFSTNVFTNSGNTIKSFDQKSLFKNGQIKQSVEFTSLADTQEIRSRIFSSSLNGFFSNNNSGEDFINKFLKRFPKLEHLAWIWDNNVTPSPGPSAPEPIGTSLFLLGSLTLALLGYRKKKNLKDSII